MLFRIRRQTWWPYRAQGPFAAQFPGVGYPSASPTFGGQAAGRPISELGELPLDFGGLTVGQVYHLIGRFIRRFRNC